MKKIIALLLALIMTFSVATVAFATDAEAPADTETSAPADGETTEEDKPVSDQLDEMLGEYDWILDLPFGTVKPALKVAKIALKLVLVYVKICRAFNLDPMETAQGILEFIGGLTEGEEAPEEAPEEEAPAAPVAA